MIPQKLEHLKEYLEKHPNLLVMYSGENGYLMRYESLEKDRIKLRSKNGHSIEFDVNQNIQYLEDRFIRIVGSLCCDFCYVSEIDLPIFEWDEILRNIAKHHAS